MRTFRPKWMALIVVMLALTVMFSRVLPPAYDFNGLFYPAIRDVLQGRFTYTSHPIYSNPPWALVLLLPLGVFSPDVGRGLLLAVTLVVMAWVMHDYRRFPVSYPLAVISLPFFAVLWVGQVEVFALVGAMIAYRAVFRRSAWLMAAGLLLLTIKPQETFLIVLLLLAGSIRQWSIRDWIKIAGMFIVVALMTSLLLGFGWLDRILSGPAYASGWQNFSVWQLSRSVPRVSVIGLWLLIAIGTVWALRRAGLSRLGLAIAAVGSNLLSPYLTGPHLLITLCFGWGLLFDRSVKWGVVTYLASLTPLLRIVTGDQTLNQLDVIFPLLVLAGLLVQVLTESPAREKSPLLTEVM